MKLRPSMLGIVLLAVVTPFHARAEIGEEISRLPDPGFGDRFGLRVDISGNSAVVAPAFPDEVYVIDVETSVVRHVLLPDVPSHLPYSNLTAAIHGDTIIVGAPFAEIGGEPSGVAYLFDADSGEQRLELRPREGLQSGQRFGYSVDVRGTRAIVGASGSGEAFIFDTTTGEHVLTVSGDNQLNHPAIWDKGYNFGVSVALTSEHAVVGSQNDVIERNHTAGAAYVFDAETGERQWKLSTLAADLYGVSVDANEELAIVGAHFDSRTRGAAYVYDLASGQLQHKLTPPDAGANGFGFPVALSSDGTAVIGDYNGRNDGKFVGSMYFFDAATGGLLAQVFGDEVGPERPAVQLGHQFGFAVAVDRGIAIVGAPNDEGGGIGSVFLLDAKRSIVLGDFNNSDTLDSEDIDLLTAEVRTGRDDPRFDLNNDGVVGDEDRRVWVEDLQNTFFGDSNLDGVFDTSDLVTVFRAGQYEDHVNMNSSWTTGDWNGTGDFTSSDLVIAFQSGGFEQGPRPVRPVPEPSSIVLLSIAFVVTQRGIQRRRYLRARSALAFHE